MASRRPSVDQVEAQALEAAAGLKSVGAKLVCIDFDATFVTVHTGGLWADTAAALRSHVRRFFELLVPLLCESDVNVAIVTFSPQVQLIRDVLQLCFTPEITAQLVIRGDDRTWTLTHDQTGTFLPLWQTDGRHLDRKFKLPFMISAALEVQRRSGDQSVIRNRDTVLVDDDAVNIRVANDSGVVGVLFDPNEKDEEAFCKRIRKLHGSEMDQSMVLRTPSKKIRSGSGVKMVAKEHKFMATGGGGARRRLGTAPNSGARTSTFNMCTPSPVMKLKCSVDMGKPRSKRASRILRNYSREMEAALPVVSESSAFCAAHVPTTPTKPAASLRGSAETHKLQTSPIVYKM
ncbi:hypothetical protein GN244_ATG06959 [Phytophthora infestans]|uniref:ATP-binding Cassette (ABC) superfamily n=1 Tax=Phytophthora infestans TaxID=4787 RepID=A0A833THE7_PHYIN|nr:hypothetical protein GN244_ATG06959 [Phytophthora infestans]KAF4148000.1 hypothetical protein GN958_ATG02810 [Phytophthora infestans]